MISGYGVTKVQKKWLGSGCTKLRCFVQEEKSLILESTVLRTDGQLVCAGRFHPPHYLGIHIKRFRDGNNIRGNFPGNVKFHAMTHIEDFIHFFPVGSALLVNEFE